MTEPKTQTAAEYFAQKVANHGVHSAIESVTTAIDEVGLYDDRTAESMVHRARFVVHRLQIAIKRADPLAIPLGPTGLTKVEGLLNQARDQLANYDRQNADAYLERANEAFDEILAVATSFDKISSGKLSDAAAVILTEMKGHSEASLSELRAALEDTHEKLTAAEKRAAEVQDEIDRKALSFNSELQRFTQRYEEEAEQRRAAIKETLETVEQEFDEAGKVQKAEIDKLVATTNEKFEGLLKSTDASSKELLGTMESDKNESNRILGLTAEAGLIGGFQREANVKRNEARTWRVVALGVFIIMGVIAWNVLVPVATGGAILNWEALISRTLLFAILGLTAAYAANEGSRASQIEEKNRRLELQLASVGPFIRDLDEPERNLIKKEFIERLYVPERAIPLEDNVKTAGTTFQLAAQLIKTLPDVLKAAK
jgi:hypothetical protein